MYAPKITINRISNIYKIYVYRSLNANDINTIEKIKVIEPVFIIDEALINGDVYGIIDDPNQDFPYGVTYNGPAPNIIPCVEYETEIIMGKITDYDYYNILKLNPLKLKYNGSMVYYSAIAVDAEKNLVTKLSKVYGGMVDCDYHKEGTRVLYYREDIDNLDAPLTQVKEIPWDEEIIVGDLSKNKINDNPFLEQVNPITEITFDDREVISRNYLTIGFQNPWQLNNKHFNYRRLKGFCVRNRIYDNFSAHSQPNFQSELPVTIERMVISITDDSSKLNTPESDLYYVIRKDGKFYSQEYSKLGLNKYSIPLGETVAIYNESSKQDYIKFQIPAYAGKKYYVSCILEDIYGTLSEPYYTEVEL
jgi:hypothetical protein